MDTKGATVSYCNIFRWIILQVLNTVGQRLNVNVHVVERLKVLMWRYKREECAWQRCERNSYSVRSYMVTYVCRASRTLWMTSESARTARRQAARYRWRQTVATLITWWDRRRHCSMTPPSTSVDELESRRRCRSAAAAVTVIHPETG